jgi:hypothetical protein
MGPGRFRVDVIGRHRRHAAPVVDPRIDEATIVLCAEIGRRLDVHRRPEHDACQSNGPHQIVEIGFIRVRHPRVRLGAEVLDDDLLDVPVLFMQFAKREQRVQPFFSCFTDADENAGGKGHARFAGQADGFKPYSGMFIGRAEMYATTFAKARRNVFEHDALRGRHLAQERDVGGIHHAGIGMRQKTGFVESGLAHLGEIRDRRPMAERRKFLACLSVAQLRFVTEREQGFRAAGFGARPRNGENLITREITAFALPRRPGEGAIGADVAAEMRQRNEHFPGMADERAVPFITQHPRFRAQLFQRHPHPLQQRLT